MRTRLISAFALTALLSACVTAAQQNDAGHTSASDWQKKWHLSAFSPFKADELLAARATLDLSRSPQVSAYMGCNRLFTNLESANNQLSFSPVAATRMACAEHQDLETAFSQAIGQHSFQYRLQNKQLILQDAQGRTLTFEAEQ